MALINQFDKLSGINYVCESISYWDMEKIQYRAKRKLIVKLDLNMGEIIPTDSRGRKHKKDSKATKSRKLGPVPIEMVNRRFYGVIYPLDKIGNTLGLIGNLKQCFPLPTNKSSPLLTL
jgi:hypothetical protein